MAYHDPTHAIEKLTTETEATEGTRCLAIDHGLQLASEQPLTVWSLCAPWLWGPSGVKPHHMIGMQSLPCFRIHPKMSAAASTTAAHRRSQSNPLGQPRVKVNGQMGSLLLGATGRHDCQPALLSPFTNLQVRQAA